MKATSSHPTLLHIEASPRGERSHSRRVGQHFLKAWRSAHPGATVITRDVGREPPPFVSEAWIEGAFTSPDEQSEDAREAMRVSNTYVDELLHADQIVITTPIYNLSLPASLKAWIDQVVRAGRTFQVSPDGDYKGLAQGKRAIVIVASGGDSRLTSAGSAYNFLEPYLRAVLVFIGIKSVEFVYAHSLSSAPEKAADAVEAAEFAVTELANQTAA